MHLGVETAAVDISVTVLGMTENLDIERTFRTEGVAFRWSKICKDTNLLLHAQIMPRLPLDPALCKFKRGISQGSPFDQRVIRLTKIAEGRGEKLRDLKSRK
jgi:hypothetical protein